MSLAALILKSGLSKVVRTGSLEIITASGERLIFGDGTGSTVIVRITDHRALWALILDPELRTGELFTDGRLIMQAGTIYDFGCLVLRHGGQIEVSPIVRLIDRFRTAMLLWSQRNTPRRSQNNVAHHYDLGDDLYALFLDPDWQYSCAYFETPDQSLADAQLAKKRHIAAKLRLKPEHNILDIGCGWGGLACYLAETAGVVEVQGVTLSQEQLARARNRADERQLSERVRFELTDYRAVKGRFDRIVSVGMFEHVGLRYYSEFFKTCRDLLSDDGAMLLHTIGCSDAPSVTNPWLTKYIFPGGHLPSLSDIVAVIEHSGLVITDIEILRLHYADTLRAWRDNFMARRKEAAAMFDDRFCRMWEYYLSMAEAAFRFDKVVVFQLQLAKKQDGIPRTRNYIEVAEDMLRNAEIANG
jgi:cyclopropane-fatty-acyl-phospholipid synthase